MDDPQAAMMQAMMQPPAVEEVTISTWRRFSFDWSEVTDKAAVAGNGEGPQRTFVLAVIDPDTGNQHRFYFGESGRDNLIRKMTGGVIVP